MRTTGCCNVLVTVSCVQFLSLPHCDRATLLAAILLVKICGVVSSSSSVYGFPMGEQGRESRLTVFYPVSLFLSPINPLETQPAYFSIYSGVGGGGSSMASLLRWGWSVHSPQC